VALQIDNECNTILKLCKDVIILIRPPQCVKSKKYSQTGITLKKKKHKCKAERRLQIFIVEGKEKQGVIYDEENFLTFEGSLQIGKSPDIRQLKQRKEL
jgi:hypothetical protein